MALRQVSVILFWVGTCVGLLTRIIEIQCFDQDKLIPLEFFGITDTEHPEDY